MSRLTRFENKLCAELTDRTGHRMTLRNILAWDLSQNWLERMKAQNEEVVFVPQLEVWCLVQNVKHSAGGRLLNKRDPNLLNIADRRN